MYNILYLPLLQYCFKFICFDGLLLFVAVSLDGFICLLLSVLVGKDEQLTVILICGNQRWILAINQGIEM